MINIENPLSVTLKYKLLYFDIFKKNNQLFLIVPVYNKNPDITDRIKITNKGKLLQLKHTFFKIVKEPVIVLVYYLNSDNNEITVTYKNIVKQYTLTHLQTKHTYTLTLTTLFKDDYYLFDAFYKYYTIQGVEHFYMYYNGKITDKIKKYFATKKVTLIEWDFRYWNDNRCEFRHHAQLGQIHHAIYKYGKGTSKYMIFCDLDEYMSHPTTTLSSMIKSNYHTYIFKNVFSKLYYITKKQTFNPNKITITRPYPIPVRSKCIHYLDTIQTIGIHQQYAYMIAKPKINHIRDSCLYHFFNINNHKRNVPQPWGNAAQKGKWNCNIVFDIKYNKYLFSLVTDMIQLKTIRDNHLMMPSKMKKKYTLITGGLGFIGSITAVEVSQYGKSIIIVDNLSNSKLDVLDKIKILVNTEIIFYQANILNTEIMNKIFNDHTIDNVIHFAAYKAVNESIQFPLKYYDNNINGLIKLLDICIKYKVNQFIFSSSCTVYGNTNSPFSENSLTGVGINNPYGQTKYMGETILQEVCNAHSNFQCICLRYFNPIGAHSSGILGENPNGIPTNLMPYILRVAYNHNTNSTLYKDYDTLNIFGGDYNTKDGTCIRDFIHVSDLAKAHLYALNTQNKGFNVYNIGTGVGTTVLELLETFIKVNKVKVPYVINDRRKGDRDIVYCNTQQMQKTFKWTPTKTIEDMCKDAWNFMLHPI
jgi:UDP-glucose 4-epimerase